MSGTSDFVPGRPVEQDTRIGVAFRRMEESELSEFGWGEGLDPPGVEGSPPSQGGRYRGTSPPCDYNIGTMPGQRG